MALEKQTKLFGIVPLPKECYNDSGGGEINIGRMRIWPGPEGGGGNVQDRLFSDWGKDDSRFLQFLNHRVFKPQEARYLSPNPNDKNHKIDYFDLWLWVIPCVRKIVAH